MSAVKDVVQPDDWYQPREQFNSLTRVPSVSDWFCIYKLPHNIYAICEPYHFQEVMSFLVLGSERNLLIDTGMGMFDIKKEIEALSDKPLMVVNTHTHFDHIGGNHQFDYVHVFNFPQAIARLNNGVSTAEVASNFTPGAFHYSKPLPFNLDEFYIHSKPAKEIIPIEEGFVFHLGDRDFRVIHTPGHSPDSIMLVCDKEKILFTGDTFYPASLYAHIQKSDGLNSTYSIYKNTMDQLAKQYSDYQLYTSHNEPLRDGKVLIDVADAFHQIEDGNLPFETDAQGLKKYQFNGFAVITC